MVTPAHLPAPASMSQAALRDAIAEALWQVSAYELAAVCESFGLTPETPDEQSPMASKRSYVKRRLYKHTPEDLLALALAVHKEYPTPALAQLLTAPGYRGVDGELKNIIFEAKYFGPKSLGTPTPGNTSVQPTRK